jgi:hypothetical protein
MARKRLEQHQVPDGMVANVPWGFDLDLWSDRMIERGLLYMAGELEKQPDGEGREFFPNLFASLGTEATTRGIAVDL